MEASSAQTSKQGTAASGTSSSPAFSTLIQSLKQNGLVPLLLGGAAFIGLALVILMWASEPDYRVLYSNLSEADGGRIITELDTLQVPYELTNSGAISIPSDQVHKVRLQLAEQGLPNGGNVGFSLMDNQAFGVSQFAEKVNYQRALEGELATSMEALGPVMKSRVHLAMAKDSVFVRERQPAKASVVLTLHSGRKLGTGQVQAIIHMVSSSVPELSPDNVTIVDQYGELLSQTSDENSLDGSKLEYISQVERSYQQRIEAILTPILGKNNLQAQVVATIDFSKRESTEERYTPNTTPETAAIRSIQRNLNMDTGTVGAQGIPGALSNTPPGVAPSPITNDDATAQAEPNNQDVNSPVGRMQQDQVVNYEVDHTIQHIQHQQGSLQQLSVAVVVNHRTGLDEEGKTVMEPRSEQELDYIQRLVRQAMGFNQIRGDQLEVVNTAFVTESNPEVELVWYERPELINIINKLIRYSAAAIALLLLYFLLVRPFIKRRQELAEEDSPPRQHKPLRAVVGDQDERPDATTTKATSSQPSPASEPFNWPQKGADQSYTEALTQAKDAAQQNPRQVARILQNWLNEDDHV